MLAQGGKVSCMIFCITRQNMDKYFLERLETEMGLRSILLWYLYWYYVLLRWKLCDSEYQMFQNLLGEALHSMNAVIIWFNETLWCLEMNESEHACLEKS